MKGKLKIWAIMTLTLAAVIVYAASNIDEISVNGYKLRKLDLSSLMPDSSKVSDDVDDSQQGFVNGIDTTHQVVLFFGDSMTSGLFYRLDDYCQENGHKLYSITWYSATTQSFAESNLLDTYIRLYHPTYYIICLGSNELFVKDLAERKKFIARIIQKIGNKPYVWVSPPNWKQDNGMDSVIMETVGNRRFFDSSKLKLERSDDHIHPTLSASSMWMDNIAQWLGKKGATMHPILMNSPKKDYQHTFTDYYQTGFKEFTGNDNPERHRRFFK